MSSKRNQPKRAGPRRHSTLAAHKKQGSKVVPPMLSAGMTFTSWTKDVFPDFLWVCAHLTDDPLRGMFAVAKAIDAIDNILEESGTSPPVYGQLTQFEAIPAEFREDILHRLQELAIYEESFPEEFAHALAMYVDAPGAWIIEPWIRKGLKADPAIAQGYFARVVSEGFHGQDLVATRAKFLYLRGMVKAGKVHLPSGSDLPELIVRYPENVSEEERSYLEPSIRAMFLGLLEGDPLENERLSWSKRFWRDNWNLFDCIRLDSPPTVGSGDGVNEADQMSAAFDYFGRECKRIRENFEEAAGAVDPDLYAPDRYEVLTGIVARCIRLIEGAAGAPLLWTGEHGSGLMRSVIEAKIIMRWLDRAGHPEIYTQFKEYGRGRLKLLKLHTEEYIDSLEEVPDELSEYLKYLDAEVNADIWEEYQEISIAPTFSGTNIRQMSIDVGLKREYDFVFAPASGTAHGDWATLDRFALTRCQNPLHLWHRIPSSHEGILVDPSIMESAMDVVEEVVAHYSSLVAGPGASGGGTFRSTGPTPQP